jgi:hypothetical protein
MCFRVAFKCCQILWNLKIENESKIPKVSGKNHPQNSQPQTGNPKILKSNENHQFTKNDQNLLMCTNVRNDKVVVRIDFDCCAIIRRLPVLPVLPFLA